MVVKKMGKKWRLWGNIQIMETSHGLRKDDIGLCLPVGDGMVKIKIRPGIDIFKQLNILYHEVTHFNVNICREIFKIGKKREDKLCDEIGDAVEKIYKKYFKEKK